MTHGGPRPGSGPKPKYGGKLTERWQIDLTEADAAEITAAIPEGEARSRWVVEAALRRARGQR
jgi:hypothetical protein